jgi:hypothetical protein
MYILNFCLNIYFNAIEIMVIAVVSDDSGILLKNLYMYCIEIVTSIHSGLHNSHYCALLIIVFLYACALGYYGLVVATPL